MIAKDPDEPIRPAAVDCPPADLPVLPTGLPETACIRRFTVPPGRAFDLLMIPSDGEPTELIAHIDPVRLWAATTTSTAHHSIAAPVVPVTIPLYGCHVIWTPNRGVVVGPAARTEQLAATLTEFALREAELRDLERRGGSLLASVEADAPAAVECDDHARGQRMELAARFRESVAIRRGLAGLGPVVHVPPVHPPTLASQLAERLRDRTRLAERHELASNQAEFIFQIYEACGQRAAEFTIARRQMGLEWAIIVILIAQLALMVVEMLSAGSST
jgi:hypothetical protein